MDRLLLTLGVILFIVSPFPAIADKSDKDDKDKYPPPTGSYPPPVYPSPPVPPMPGYSPPVTQYCPPPPSPPAQCPPPPSPPPQCPPPPPPSPPPPSPPPPPPSPPPPPKCNPGCIPAPPCSSCDKCGSKPPVYPSPPYSPPVYTPPPYSPPVSSPPETPSTSPPKKSPPKTSPPKKSPPSTSDDLTDSDVQNLNDLLNVQFILNNIYLKASLGTKSRAPGSSSSSKVVLKDGEVDQQNVVSGVLDQFSVISIKQTSSMMNLLKSKAAQTPKDLNITDDNLSGVITRAFNGGLQPPFNVQDSPTNLLLAVQTVGPSLVASVATSILPNLQSNRAVTLVSGILPVVAGQDASLRTLLYTEKDSVVQPYNYTVSQFMGRTTTMFRGLAGGDGGASGTGTSDGQIIQVTALGTGIGITAKNILNFISSALGIIQFGGQPLT